MAAPDASGSFLVSLSIADLQIVCKAHLDAFPASDAFVGVYPEAGHD
jgi:hypothetical protein